MPDSGSVRCIVVHHIAAVKIDVGGPGSGSVHMARPTWPEHQANSRRTPRDNRVDDSPLSAIYRSAVGTDSETSCRTGNTFITASREHPWASDT